MKRIVTIQDFSCVGKCSLAVALPVLSAMGIECAALPTQLLSAHTAFEGFRSRDLGDFAGPILDHWKQLGLGFDGVYTGFLGSVAQVELARRVLEDFPAPLRFVDPAMGDCGRLYPGIAPELPGRLRQLCRLAQVVSPNVTEACLLTGLPYRPQQEEAYLRQLLEALLELGPDCAILTGLHTDTQHMGVAAMDRSGRLMLHYTQRVDAMFHGAGDLFASCCVGAMTRGLPPGRAIALAADYVFQTILVTHQNPDASWYGIDFETTLPSLIRQLDSMMESEAP